MEETINLVNVHLSYADEIRAYRQEFIDAGDSMDGCGSLRRTETPEDWLEQVKLYADKATVPENRVQATQFMYVREADRRVVGMIQVRHYFNEYLEKYAGNIGYSVRPSERQKGYAKQMLHACLPYCREIGLKKVLITCIDTNKGSRKTILANDGIYESTVFEPEENVNLQRYWITL